MRLSIFFLVIGITSFLFGLGELDWKMIIVGVICTGFGILFLIEKINQVEKEDKYKLNRIAIEEERRKLLIERGLMDSQWVSDTYSTICAVDEQNKSIWFFFLDDKLKYTIRENYSYEDILEVEVLVDGETITSTSRGSQLGGALLGGVLAGGVGAIIGGLSGSTTSKEKIGSMHLKITVNDISNPIILLKIFNVDEPWDKNDEELKRYSDIVVEWQGIFAVIINSAGKKEEAKIENNPSDEIRMLHGLWKDGILTEEEYSNQKQKLLAR